MSDEFDEIELPDMAEMEKMGVQLKFMNDVERMKTKIAALEKRNERLRAVVDAAWNLRDQYDCGRWRPEGLWDTLDALDRTEGKC